MPTQATLSTVQKNFEKYIDQVNSSRDAVIIHSQGKEDVALISASELQGLLETAHLLRSPNNAKRLLTALKRAQNGGMPPEPLEGLYSEFQSAK